MKQMFQDVAWIGGVFLVAGVMVLMMAAPGFLDDRASSVGQHRVLLVAGR